MILTPFVARFTIPERLTRIVSHLFLRFARRFQSTRTVLITCSLQKSGPCGQFAPLHFWALAVAKIILRGGHAFGRLRSERVGIAPVICLLLRLLRVPLVLRRRGVIARL